MWNNLHIFAILYVGKPMEKLRHKRPCPYVCLRYTENINLIYCKDDERNIWKIIIKGISWNI